MNFKPQAATNTMSNPWYRIFGANDVQPQPKEVLEHLCALGAESGRFRGDHQGWFAAELLLPDGASFHLERYLAAEDDIRDELNTWAAWLETMADNPHHARLMQHMIGTRQLFTLCAPEEQTDRVLAEEFCIGVCRYLAGVTDGVYQVDERGFFAADGMLLVREA
jgi:hypothetical protein